MNRVMKIAVKSDNLTSDWVGSGYQTLFIPSILLKILIYKTRKMYIWKRHPYTFSLPLHVSACLGHPQGVHTPRFKCEDGTDLPKHVGVAMGYTDVFVMCAFVRFYK
jgi:hypothetical protein